MYNLIFTTIIPIALQHFLVSSNSLLDNFMISRLGSASIAAVGSANRFLGMTKLTLYGIASASAILTSQFNAKDDKKGMYKSFVIHSVIGFTTGLIFLIFYYVNRDSIAASFSSDIEVQELAKNFLDVGIFSVFTLNTIYAIVTTIRSRGIIAFPFILSITSLCVNFILNIVLIFGKWGFPAMGVKGSAIATLLSEIMAIVICFSVLYFSKYDLFGGNRFIKIPSSFIKKYLILTTPVVAVGFLSGFSGILIHNLFGKLGKEALAAYGIISPIEMILSHLFIGFGSAILIVVGKELGKDNFDSAYKKAKDISFTGAFLSGILGIIITLLSGKIVSFYKLEVKTMIYLREMIRIFGLFMSIKVFNYISSTGTFRTGGDSLFIFWVGVISNWILALPFAYIGFYILNWKIREIYLLINCIEVVSSIFFIYRFRSKKWMKNLTK